jgi:hypothetical protein
LDSSQVAQVYLLPTNGDDACEEGCGLGVAKLVSGSLSKGIWSASFLIPSTTTSSNYSLRVAFPKLKGVPGFYADYSGEIKVLGTSQPRIIPFYNFSSLRISTTEAKAGQTIEGYFALKSNDDKISTPACIIDGVVGWTNAILISGTAMAGNWACKVFIPSTAITGPFRLQVAVVGYANNNKNEEWADIGQVYIQGSTPAGTLSLAECRSVFVSQQASLRQAITDISIVTKYIADPESFREFFTVNSRRWSDALMLVTSIWNKNLARTETTLMEIRSSKVQTCGGYAEFKGVFEKYAPEFESSIRIIKDQNSAIAQWYSNIQSRITDPQKFFNPQVEVGSIDIQSISEKTLGITTISFAYQANSGVAKIECSVSIGVCVVRDNGNSSSGQTYFGLAEVRNYSPGANIDLSLRQYAPSGKMVASIQQPFSTLKPALQPRISAATSIVGGCTFKILNYDPAFNWFAKSEMRVLKDGTATIKTLVTTDEYISTSRPGYQSVNALNTLFRCVPLSQTQTIDPDQIIEDDGVEEEPVGDLRVRKESSGKFLMTITSNLDTEKISIVATRKGRATIRFSASTNEAGSVQIRTSRNLSGYTLKLIFDGATLKTAKVG